MAEIRLWHLGAILGLAMALVMTASHSEEDFAFEMPTTEEQDAFSGLHTHPMSTPVQKLWGIPDTMANVGKLFHMKIPGDAFSGEVDHYEARGPEGAPLPSWLVFDTGAGVFEGVPGAQDVGEHYITVRALGRQSRDWAKDVFSIDVTENSRTEPSKGAVPLAGQHQKFKCNAGEDATMLIIVLDAKFEQMKPKQRILAIKNLSGFLSLPHDLFQLQPQNFQEDLLGDTVVLAGPGNVKKRSKRQSTSIQWQVGCDGHLWKQYTEVVQGLQQQARDGTLWEVLMQPVVGWHVKTAGTSAHRERREVGSGDYDDDDYIVDEDETEDNEDVESETEQVPSVHIVPTMPSPVFPEATASHPHRHHHGELEAGPSFSLLPEVGSSVGNRLPTSPVIYGTILPTPVLDPVRPTHLLSTEVNVEPSRTYHDLAEITPSPTPVFVSEVEASVATDMPSSQVTEPLPSSSSTSPGSSSSGTSGSSTADMTETSPMTDESTSSSTPLLVTEERSSTDRSTTERPPTARTTEEVVYGEKNFPPTIEHRLAKQVPVAGKVFRFVIPEDTFSDLEDGNTRNLRLIFKTKDGTSVPSTSWLQFIPEKQEVFGLPLEEEVSIWKFIIEAMDKEGKSVSENLELVVQHHKGSRNVNHEFTLHLHIEKKYEFASPVDWQLKVLDCLTRLYGDPDPSQFIVRRVDEKSGAVNFTWTNESLPRDICPKDEINRLYKVLVQNEDGDPSSDLISALSPVLKPNKVTYRGLQLCESVIGMQEKPPPIPKVSDFNYPPSLRNHVDYINATVGRLLVFKVPEDTFYDPEDGSTRNMKLSLLTMDRTQVPLTNWLQFDVKNQEFYGIPMPGDEGHKEYQLVCEDRDSRQAYDGLIVVVQPAAKVKYTAQFAMLTVPHLPSYSSAALKRKFVEKLKVLFGDQNTNAISLSSVTEDPTATVVNWHNRTLPTDHCPEDEIKQLRKLLINEDHTVTERVEAIMQPEFNVKTITVTPFGKCQGELTVWHSPDGSGQPSEDTQPVGTSDEYLVTYIVPAVIIATMLILAGIVACFLYRRRRTGKMDIGDEDERQSFRNKGIPVIFQDELEERPDPGNKSPVIMKEEKPPLPPPEYQRGEPEQPASPPTAAHPLLGENTASEDPPYQPPPPFTSSRDSGRQNRPKPTPTYRKPPPYVPP